MPRISLAALAVAILSLLATSDAAPTVAKRRPRPVVGPNFPPSDPAGAKILASAADSRAKWHQGMGRVAGIPSWDLSNLNGKNYVTGVKNQDGCGTCVAFATLAALEATINYKTNQGVPVSSGLTPLPDLSEQQLHFCLGKRGCGEGWWLWEAAVLAASSIVDETCMPYDTQKVAGSCTQSTCARTPGTVKGGTVQVVDLKSWEEVKKHIINHGPVVTTLLINTDFPGFDDNSDMWAFPSTYVWPGTKNNKGIGSHAVMCYAFDDNMLNGVNATTRGVVSCKNSWGVEWGNQGHFKAAYGADGLISGENNVYGFIWKAGAATSTATRRTSTSRTMTRRTSTVRTTSKKIVRTTSARAPRGPRDQVRTTKRVVQTTRKPAPPRKP